MTQTSPTLREVITDCGGVGQVAERIRRTNQYVHLWIKNGHLPLSELKGRTQYSEALEGMQQEGKLSAAEIRRIGLKV